MRECCVCNQAKPLDEFSNNHYICKLCNAARQRERYWAAKGLPVPDQKMPGGPRPGRLRQVVEAAAARFDAKPVERASIEARRELAQTPADPLPQVVHEPETITVVEEHRLKAEVRRLTAQAKSLVAELSDARRMADIARAAGGEAVAPIVPRERSSGLREATAMVLASDWHIEEEVRPEQVSGRNRYNLEISRARMTRFFEATRWAIDFNRSAFTIRDLILWLGGDMITNYLHDDNVESNLLSPVQAIAYAQQCIADGIRFLLQDGQLERIVVPCNDGNHGRLTDKTRSATRTANSIEWLLYQSLAREFAHEPRVQFVIAEGEHLYLDVYGRTIRFTHGDTTKYGGGIGGATIPIFKALSRWQTVRHADLTVMGHYHQHTSLTDLIINGSLIGYSPYSLSIGARFEEPAQNFTILDPQRWKSVTLPLWVSDRGDDNVITDGKVTP